MKLMLLSVALLALALPAVATTPSGGAPAGRNVAPPASQQQPAAAMANDSSGMRRGSLDAVGAKGTLRVDGQTLQFDPRQVKIFGADGKPRSVGALQKGSKISFTLDPRDPARQQVGVIYLH